MTYDYDKEYDKQKEVEEQEKLEQQITEGEKMFKQQQYKNLLKKGYKFRVCWNPKAKRKERFIVDPNNNASSLESNYHFKFKETKIKVKAHKRNKPKRKK